MLQNWNIFNAKNGLKYCDDVQHSKNSKIYNADADAEQPPETVFIGQHWTHL